MKATSPPPLPPEEQAVVRENVSGRSRIVISIITREEPLGIVEVTLVDVALMDHLFSDVRRLDTEYPRIDVRHYR